MAMPEAVSYGIFVTEFISSSVLVLATLKSKHLRSTCNFLIGTEAFLYALAQPLTVSEKTLIPAVWGDQVLLGRCFWLLTMHILVIEMGSMMPLAIAVERFLSVRFPIWASFRQAKKYAAIMVAVAFVFGVCQTTYFGSSIFLTRADTPVVCTPVAVYTSNIALIAQYKCLVVVGLCWAIYIGIWLSLRHRLRSQSSHNQNPGQAEHSFRRLTHTLLVVIVLVSVGWLSPSIVSLVFGGLIPLPRGVYEAVFSTVSTVSLNLASAATTPALYTFSKEYRLAMNELFSIALKSPKWLCKCLKLKNQDEPTKKNRGKSLVIYRYRSPQTNNIYPSHLQNFNFTGAPKQSSRPGEVDKIKLKLMSQQQNQIVVSAR